MMPHFLQLIFLGFFAEKIYLCYQTVVYMNSKYSLNLCACGLAAKGYKKYDYALNFHSLYYALRAHSSHALNHVNRQQGCVKRMNSILIFWSQSVSMALFQTKPCFFPFSVIIQYY